MEDKKHMDSMRINSCIIILLTLVGFGCSSPTSDEISKDSPGQSKSKNTILPLGASRVEGDRPLFESFRYELWKDLSENQWEFDFVGSQTDEASYPAVHNDSFDRDHEGHGGWTSGEIVAELPSWLEQVGTPQIVLFSSPGGNDMLQGLPFDEAASNIYSIIEQLRAANPSVVILIEKMAPGRAELFESGELANYYEQLHGLVDTIVSEQSTESSPIIPLDMYSDFREDYLADDVHYNEEGADFIALRYYEVLVDVLQD